MDPFLAAGIVGMVLILIGFLMVQLHRWTQDDFIYDLVNFVGSALLVAYAFVGSAWPFFILNGIWALYSLRDLVFLDRWPGQRRKMTRRAG